MSDALLHNQGVIRKKGYALDDASHHLIRHVHLQREREYAKETFLFDQLCRSIPPMPVVGKDLILKIRWEGATGHVIDEGLMLELEGIGTGHISLG